MPDGACAVRADPDGASSHLLIQFVHNVVAQNRPTLWPDL